MPLMPAGVVSFARPESAERIIRIPALGLTVRVRMGPGQGGGPTVIETTNAAGFGPPLYRRGEIEIFQVVSGRYLFEVDGQRFIARRGDMVRVAGGVARAFVNITGTGARQQIIIDPGVDAAAYFEQLAFLLDLGRETPRQGLDEGLKQFGQRWGIEFLAGPIPAEAAV
ncbi:cupin domain-containing protein [Variovorax sp.]|uniref:cupin domain-containing protein n=1 Tax=Variovorax sp. TaxID=1871043 RepID=UPI002D3EA631|nr:cupin domain-containing protein [Variovorax sp.]HYP84150.1 cupin domain-containing protein [Variovorax sp.]